MFKKNRDYNDPDNGIENFWALLKGMFWVAVVSGITIYVLFGLIL